MRLKSVRMQTLSRILFFRCFSPSAIASCFLLLYCSFINAAPYYKTNCQDAGPLVFGILPFISIEQLVYQFSPLADYLSGKLQVPVRIETAPDFVEFARRTHEETRYDILFTAPHFYTQAHRKAGYRLIASIDSPEMWAVIVVPSLRFRLIASVVTIEIVMLSLLVWNNITIIHTTHTDRLRDTASSMIRQIANTSGNYMVAVDYATLQRLPGKGNGL